MIPELEKGKDSTASLENDSTARLGKCFHSQIGLIHFHSQVREMIPLTGKGNDFTARLGKYYFTVRLGE